MVIQGNKRLDVVVRFHDALRLQELRRCVFSLVGQTYRPLHVNLVVQRFNASEVEQTRAALQPLLAMADAPGLTIRNWEHPEPKDARSVLINHSLRTARGRYLAVLDYDDVLYPEAYELAVGRLRASGATIVFGSVCVKQLDVHDTFMYAVRKLRPFKGSGLRDLFVNNFCPIHSYVVDRTCVPDEFLFFEPFMTMLEDYDFLLRICAQFPSDFGLLSTELGEYYYKTDGSNTSPHEGDLPTSELPRFQGGIAFIEQRRRTTPVAPDVQRLLGISQPVPGMTIRDYLDGTGSTGAAA